MQNYTIHVTQDDIYRGIRGSCKSCPIALAMSRVLGFISVDARYFSTESDGSNGYLLPHEAINFIRDFDSKNRVEPFSFNISV